MKRLNPQNLSTEIIDRAFVNAAANGKFKAADLTLSMGANLRTQGPQAAAAAHSAQAFEWLHQHHVPIDMPDGERQETPLMTASFNCNIETMQALIRMGADINKKNAAGNTPLILSMQSTATRECIEDQAGKRVNLLLDAGADPLVANKDGDTALHTAVMYGKTIELAKIILKHGTPINLKNKRGETSLHHAMYSDSPVEIAEFLLSSGAQVNSQDDFGTTPLMLAAQKNYARTTEILLNNHVSLDTQDEDGETALFRAIKNRAPDTTRMLLQRGANIDQANKNGLKPIDVVRTWPDDINKQLFLRLMGNPVPSN